VDTDELGRFALLGKNPVFQGIGGECDQELVGGDGDRKIFSNSGIELQKSIPQSI
jgi:hypothetical protein